jgi:hypothetical protein
VRPSLSDFLLVSLVVWLFVAGSGWENLLADGDTGWHIRTGEYILDARSVPARDVFSFSKPGEPWFAWEWLADVIFAMLHRLLGLKGVVAFTGLLLSAASLLVFRYMLWRGANAFVALFVTLLAAGAGSIHFLARPHIFTLLFLAPSLWLLERDRRRPDRWIWLLVPATALWTNLHGGFLALLACLAVTAAGSSLESGWRAARRYAALLLVCGAASLANPYGIRLHWHAARYLRSDWIRQAVDEFQSPRFRSESLFHFELLLLAGLLLAGTFLAKKRFSDAMLVLLWAHLALVSVRHVPVFAIVVAPLIAAEATALWERWAQSFSPRSIPGVLAAVARDLAPGFRRNSLWAPVFLAAVLWLTPGAKWPADFPSSKFPVGILRAHPELLDGRKVFATDEWGDYLIYRGWPRQKVFIDGRSDFYGEPVGKEYLRLLDGREGWRNLLEKHGFEAVMVPSGGPLAELLAGEAGWRPVARDPLAAVFERADFKAPEPNQTAARLR